MMFGDNMKAFSILFQRPIVQIGVAVEEGATQLQAFFIFSLCQKGSTLIPEAHQLFQTGGSKQHVLFTGLS